MKNANIGVVNFLISNKLKDSYFNEKLIEESKKLTLDFLEIIKESPILQLEFNVFNNIENKHIDNDLLATRYIDNNIKLFEIYTIEEINKEHEKLIDFITEDSIPSNNKKIVLYNAINNLIKESIDNYDNIDVDSIHESFTIVLNHVKESKNIDYDDYNKIINEDVIEIAVDKFNKKYEVMNEDDKNLLETLIKSNFNEKKELLENFKSETLIILNNLNKDNVKDNISKAIVKINEMQYNQENVDNDIISLHELKKDLL